MGIKLNDFDFDKGIMLPDGSFVKVIPNHHYADYIFYNAKGEETERFKQIKQPTAITNRMAVGKLIFSKIDVYHKMDTRSVLKEFNEIKQTLQAFLELYREVEEEILVEKEQALEEQKRLEEEEYQEQIRSAMEGYGRIDDFLIWLGCEIEWLTAGERVNILIAFLTFCSQVILRNPISLIGLGEGSSGKNHVSDIASMMIPDKYIIFEKNPTLASMFRRSQEDPYFYDGKIVFYGDMGEDTDQEEVQSTKRLLKEMQTDGFLSRPITMKVDGEYQTVNLELYGNPCLHYQTVPNYDFDDQELSRSILYTPRMDNRYEFNLRSTYLEFTGGVTYKKEQKIHNYLQEKIPFVVEGLRQKFCDISIVNPYFDVIIEFVGDNEYYKRDLNKYNSILKVITAFNSQNRPIHEIGGEKIIFTNKYDVALFITLFEQYNESIQANLSLKAVEILNDLKENIDDWCYRDDKDETLEFDLGVTIARYIEIGNVKLSKRSMQRYFKELNSKGYIQVVGTINRSNVYNLTKQKIKSIDSVQDLKKGTKNIIYEEYGEKILEHISEDTSNDQAHILSEHEFVEKPKWAK